MLTLNNYIKESLLDDEDVLVNDNAIEFEEDLNNPQYELYDLYDSHKKASLKDNHILFYDTPVYIERGFKPLTDFYPRLDTMESESMISITLNNQDQLTDDTICKNFITQRLSVWFKNKASIENINLYQNAFNASRGTFDITAYNDSIKLKNINIYSNKLLFRFFTQATPIFNNVKINGSAYMLIYNEDFDSRKTPLTKSVENILDTNYKTATYNRFADKTTEKKADIKGIASVLGGNNDINALSENYDICKIKPGSKITDIIPKLPPNIYGIKIQGNKINCNLLAPGHYNDNIIEYSDIEQGGVLSDGWVIKFSKRKI